MFVQAALRPMINSALRVGLSYRAKDFINTHGGMRELEEIARRYDLLVGESGDKVLLIRDGLSIRSPVAAS